MDIPALMLSRIPFGFTAMFHIDAMPFPLVATIFTAALAALAGSLLPYMVPFSITIEASSSLGILSLLLWGVILFVLPLIVICALVFRPFCEINIDSFK